MTKKEYKKWAELLKPYWAMRIEAYDVFLRKERAIEKKMNRELKPPVELEFFYSDDGGVCGIGAVDYINRKRVPLIHDVDLWGNE